MFFSLCVVVLVVAVLSGLVTVAVALLQLLLLLLLPFSSSPLDVAVAVILHPPIQKYSYVRSFVRPSVGSQSPGIVSRVSAVFQSAIANWLDGSLIRFLGS